MRLFGRFLALFVTKIGYFFHVRAQLTVPLLVAGITVLWNVTSGRTSLQAFLKNPWDNTLLPAIVAALLILIVLAILTTRDLNRNLISEAQEDTVELALSAGGTVLFPRKATRTPARVIGLSFVVFFVILGVMAVRGAFPAIPSPPLPPVPRYPPDLLGRAFIVPAPSDGHRRSPVATLPYSAPYPWLRFSASIQNGITVADIGIVVRDYINSDSAFDSLFNLTFGIYAIIGVDPSEQLWYECILKTGKFPEWNGIDNPGTTTGITITFSGSPDAVLEYVMNARSGHWKGLVSVRATEGIVETDQSIIGTILLAGKAMDMSRREVLRARVPIATGRLALQVTKEQLSQLGVPTHQWTVSELKDRCPGGYGVEGTAKASSKGTLDLPGLRPD